MEEKAVRAPDCAQTRSKYVHLMQSDEDLRRWYDNLLQGSRVTAKKNLRRLGYICKTKNISPRKMLELAKADERWSYNFLIDLVREMTGAGYAGSYIEDSKKVVESWLKHNGLKSMGKIKVKGADSTPTLTDKGAISQIQLRSLFSCSPPKVRVIESLLSQSGLRLESIGDEEGSDGLKIADLPELQINNDNETPKISFLKIPSIVTIRPELSKARHQYFSFLSKEGCEYLTEYLLLRMERGEKLNKLSPLISPEKKGRKNNFVRTTLIGRLVKQRLEMCGINARPYDLRSMFDTQLLIAESKGLIIRDYRVFFMGHKGDIEHRYTLNRNKLPDPLVQDLRNKYVAASKYLESSNLVSSGQSQEDEIRTQMLLLAGYDEEEIASQKLLYLSSTEVTRKIKERILSAATGEELRQKLIRLDELDSYLAKGRSCVQARESRNT
ncbi:MAG: site-specific integrase, partial [Nitrososphaerota archaeon]|nr:site-specific integrase [Nitrososphaerota archaeon]